MVNLQIAARAKALRHIRFCFPKRGCRIWRIYSWLGLRTHAVFCQCGEVFGADDTGLETLERWKCTGC